MPATRFLCIIGLVFALAMHTSKSICLHHDIVTVHEDEDTYWNGYVRASKDSAIDVHTTELARRCILHTTYHCRQCAALQHPPTPHSLVHALIYYHALKLTHRMQSENVSPGCGTARDMFYAHEGEVEAYGSASWGLVVLKQDYKRDTLEVRIARGESNVIIWPGYVDDRYEHYYLYTIADSTLTHDSSTQKLFQHMHKQYTSEQVMVASSSSFIADAPVRTKK